jgi:hypothetical protein
VACLELFPSGSANQPLGDAHDPPKVSPPTPAVRTKRAFRSAPVVLVRGVRMPACAETGTSIVMQHGLPGLSSHGHSQPGAQARQVAPPLPLRCLQDGNTTVLGRLLRGWPGISPVGGPSGGMACRRRHITRPATSPTTAATASQAAKLIATHHHDGLIPPAGISLDDADCPFTNMLPNSMANHTCLGERPAPRDHIALPSCSGPRNPPRPAVPAPGGLVLRRSARRHRDTS